MNSLLTVNSNDEAPFNLQEVAISKTNKYVHLGALISHQLIAAQVKDHITRKAAHVRKFYPLLMKNSECPYPIKYKVWSSALNSAILYSCETWLTNDLCSVETPYNNTLKQMLSVHQTTKFT